MALAIISGVVWSQHDQTEYAERLDYLGLTENAQVYHSKQSTTAPQALAAINRVGLTNYQVQFQTGHTTYLYATGDLTTLPLSSGQWFSDQDFKSQLPVAIAGRNLADSLYSGGSQRYYQLGQQYIPVIGIMSNRKNSPLNDQVILTPAAPTFQQLGLKDVKVTIDAQNLNRHQAALKKIFKVKPTRLRYTNNQQTWLQTNGATVLWGAGLIIASAFAGWIVTFFWRPKAIAELSEQMRRQYIRGLWFKLTQHGFAALLLGTIFGMWRFYLTSLWPLLAFNAGLWLLYCALCWVSLRQYERKEADRATT
ncbi:hypothetical protein FC34_GL000395 [Lacticaseibacillus brantae DSM 23927]|uniref:MacB-like periplasmic core domain-containing protein n=1 Tax=Lacticaseibacillus brantae DSM 23927 TaxID=1423727 RepID=A0A0R2AZH5_9LACO|nr:hypothetical protein FC34_GL000395 [Lacticaseibacillus brantae DSM 23927]